MSQDLTPKPVDVGSHQVGHDEEHVVLSARMSLTSRAGGDSPRDTGYRPGNLTSLHLSSPQLASPHLAFGEIVGTLGCHPFGHESPSHMPFPNHVPAPMQGGEKMQMHFFLAFFCISRSQWFFAYFAFFSFFCICFAFSFLLMSQSMDKFVSRGVANDAAADVDDTPELPDGEGDNELVTSAGVERSFSLAGNMDTKYRHGLPNATRRITNMLMFNGDIEGRFNPV